MRQTRTSLLVTAALMTALIAVCAQISMPVPPVPASMSIFAVLLCGALLGPRWGACAVGSYVFMGAIGLPVFSGFQGGLGALMGATGGYIAGFLATALIYWLITALGRDKEIFRLLGMVLGLLACYLLGTLWFLFGYLSGDSISLGAVLLKCVVPYLLPDAAKLILAWLLSRRLRQFV